VKKSSEIVEAVFRDKRLENAGRYISLFGSWREIAGRDLADHCDLVDIRNNAAVVAVDHPGWMQMLQMEKKRILKTLKNEHPALTITSIQIFLVTPDELAGHRENKVTASSPGTSPPDTSSQARNDPEPGSAETDPGSSRPPDPVQIDDPALRGSLERLGKAIAERNARKSEKSRE
jgi:hypothetical protein